MKHMFGCVKIKNKYVTKADAGLILSILLLSGVLAVFFLMTGLHRDGTMVVVEQDGSEILRFPLDEERTVRIAWENGCNTVQVHSGSVQVSEADCPDQICVRQGKISGCNESIVCLPHRLLIRLEGSSDAGPDAITN